MIPEKYQPDFSIEIGGKPLEPDIRNSILSLCYESSLDQADMFRIVLDNSDEQIMDSPLFLLGQEMEIYMGYAGDLQLMMLGEVVTIHPSFPEGEASTISVYGYDKSYRMRHNHKRRTFVSTNAGDIAATIARENNLEIQADASSIPLEYKSQYGSDMAILKELARRNQFEVFVKESTLHFRRITEEEQPVVLEWGTDLLSFSPRLSIARQKGMILLQDYDRKLAQKVESMISVNSNGTAAESIKERLGEDFLNQLEQFGKIHLSNTSLNSYAEADSYAEALMHELLQGLFEGNGACEGLPELRAGKNIQILGVGEKFSGIYQLREVKHTISSNSGYRTDFRVAQPHHSSLLDLMRKYSQEDSPHRQEKMYAPVIAKLEDNVDPEELGRVRLRYPWLDEEDNDVVSNWAHLASPDIGMYFIPQVGDDVVVVFEKGDFDRPIVLGTLWNMKMKPPEENSALKLIVSPSGARIEFDEEGGITLISAGGATLKLDGSSNRIDLNPGS